MEVTPAGVFILLLAIISIFDYRKGILIFFLVIPINNLVVINAIGRGFRPNEIIILALSAHVVFIIYNKWRKNNLKIHITYPYLYLFIFLIICVISTVHALINPPSGLFIYPYNVVSSFGAFDFQEVSLGLNNFTQLLMRFFFIGSIIVIGIVFKTSDLFNGTKIIIYTSLLSGLIGIFYQVTMSAGVTSFAELMNYIGFIRFDLDPEYIGPVPRMYSVQGEPGTVANMLLFALALVSVPILSTDKHTIFGEYSDIFAAILLIGLILMSTGTTGYGGLVILFLILLASTILTKSLSFTKFFKTTMSIAVIGFVFLAFLVTSSVDLASVVEYQISKLSFQASSGSIRLRYLLLELEVINQRPVLGIGVGSHQSTSVFGTIVTDVGLMGFTIFCWMHLVIFREAIRDSVIIHDVPLSAMYSIAGITLFATNMFARDLSSLYFGWYWIAVGAPLIIHTDRIRTNVLEKQNSESND